MAIDASIASASPTVYSPAVADSEDWLGCESVHPLTWVPGTAALGFADMSCGRPARQEGPLAALGGAGV